MILTVTPNAAVDRTYRIDGFALDRVNRPSEAFTVAGGKGINVARVYQTLGGRAIATGFLGGNNGRIVADSLEREGITNACVPVTGETRLCIAVVDPTTGTQTEINECGAEVGTEEVDQLIQRVDSLLTQPLTQTPTQSLKQTLTQTEFEFVVLSGSLPPGVPPTLYADLIAVAHRAGVRTVLDSSGEALRQGLYARPWMVKPNRAELAALKIDSAQALQSEYNIPIVALTHGSEGAVLVAEGEVWCATPPPIEFASAVASGDSFLAAFLWAWNHFNNDPASALRLATGAGAANAAVIGAGFCTRESIFALAAKAELHVPHPEMR